MDPKSAVAGVHHYLARRYSDPYTQAFMAAATAVGEGPLPLERGPDGGIRLVFSSRSIAPADALALELDAVRETGEAAAGRSVKHVAVTVPSLFGGKADHLGCDREQTSDLLADAKHDQYSAGDSGPTERA